MSSDVAPVKPKRKKFNYFFLNGLLHKSLHINRGTDTITAWCYPLAKRISYTYSDTKRHHEVAFTTTEVSAMIMRKKLSVEKAIWNGCIEEPQFTYGLNEHRRKFKYMWNEKNILELHAYFSTVHRGRPRKDGMITPAALPSQRELRAIIRNEEVLYVRGSDGEFRPTWRAKDF